MDASEKLKIGRVRHKQTSDEKGFYKTLGAAMRDARERNNCTQSKIGKLSGFSAQQIRKFESGEVAIPSYVMMKYAQVFCVASEELCANWADAKTRSLYERILTQNERQKIKRFTDAERVLITRLRIEHNKIGSMQPAELLLYLKKRDLDLIYCIKALETADDLRVMNIVKSLREQIYELYMLHVNDPKGRPNITEGLYDTPKDVPEQEVLFNLDEE